MMPRGTIGLSLLELYPQPVHDEDLGELGHLVYAISTAELQRVEPTVLRALL